MTTTGHAVAPEEVMVWVDGELTESEAQAMAAHVEGCAECAGVAAGFRRMSKELAEWGVEEVPAWVKAAVVVAAEAGKEYPHGRLRRTWGTRQWWVMGLSSAAVVLVVMAGSSLFRSNPSPPEALIMDGQSRNLERLDDHCRGCSSSAAAGPVEQRYSAAIAGMVAPRSQTDEKEAALQAASPVPAVEQRKQALLSANVAKPAMAAGAPLAAMQVPTPMIARTVSLTIRVKAGGDSRTAMEAMLARRHGYTAQMNANTAEGSAQMFSASLRIPAGELEAALQEFRTLGRVESESQTGEEMTPQHQDLEVRLKMARETEARFQGILQQRTGNVSDVLEVEQEIARVRGEIETMEAEQAGLENRVQFATVELTLMENYQARLNVADSVGTGVRNAFVKGFENGWGTVVGMVVFAGEYGPAILIWVVVLGVPCVLVWGRYRRMRG